MIDEHCGVSTKNTDPGDTRISPKGLGATGFPGISLSPEYFPETCLSDANAIHLERRKPSSVVILSSCTDALGGCRERQVEVVNTNDSTHKDLLPLYMLVSEET